MWIGRAWETFVGVLNEPHISKKRLLGSLKWKEGKNVDGINDKKKKRLFLHLHTVFVNPLIKGLTCRCRCQACTQSITYLSQEPHLEIRGCFVIFFKVFYMLPLYNVYVYLAHHENTDLIDIFTRAVWHSLHRKWYRCCAAITRHAFASNRNALKY